MFVLPQCFHHNLHFLSQFRVLSLQIELTLTSSGEQVSATTKDPKDTFTQMDYQAVKYDTSRTDVSKDWVYVLIPVLLGVILITVLTVIMCCKREGL